MSNEEKGGGVGVLAVVGIVFIILKLCKLINWSWIWVLAPFWAPTALVIIIIVIAFIIHWIKEALYKM